ncbi:65-kDa microtubule-associated protein 1 [Zea mays]|uniref:65-kDa microtubule-associated protein 1 n=1 Tax=Zea mays TaxID=4577 RepID=A0A3L6G733_MAIZE|nr:65-kDa microtubule-associated protein 1 [Zea mays]
MTKEVLESDVYEVFERIQDPNLVYPDYYLNPFHAYDEGNLSWLAATEAEPATMSIAKRAIPEATSIEEANQIVRGNWLNVIEEHHLKYLGSSQGLDLSPYCLAVAAQKEEKLSRPKPIRWVHANGEATGLSSDSFDLVSLAYVCHECPARAITGLVKEAFRVLRPGGTIALTDNSSEKLGGTLMEQLAKIEPMLEDLRHRRDERVNEFKAIQSNIVRLQAENSGAIDQGDPATPVVDENDLSLKRLGELKEHLNDLQTEKNGRLQKIDIQTNSIHEMCNIMSIDLKMALKDAHPSYAELGGSKPMSISNNSLDRLSEKVHALNHEKKQRLRKVA